MADVAKAMEPAQAVLVKVTLDGSKVEVIDGWVCLAGIPEADHLVALIEHPNRQVIAQTVPGATHVAGRLPLTHEQAAIAQGAMTAAQRRFDASPAGIAQRLRHAIWQKSAAEGIE